MQNKVVLFEDVLECLSFAGARDACSIPCVRRLLLYPTYKIKILFIQSHDDDGTTVDHRPSFIICIINFCTFLLFFCFFRLAQWCLDSFFNSLLGYEVALEIQGIVSSIGFFVCVTSVWVTLSLTNWMTNLLMYLKISELTYKQGPKGRYLKGTDYQFKNDFFVTFLCNSNV